MSPKNSAAPTVAPADVTRLLALLERNTQETEALRAEVRAIRSSQPPPAAATVIMQPTRQEQILFLARDAWKEQRGISTAEIASKLGINRQQVATALYQLEDEGAVRTVRGVQVTTPEGKRRGPDIIYPADILHGWN